jgi:hypothetical protein
MILEFVRIENIGDSDRERVVLRAQSEIVEIGTYAIFRCRAASDAGVSAGPVLNAYWFPNKQINKNDWVVLYTQIGQRSEKKADNGTTSYFFYWGLSGSLWTAGIAAVIVETPRWKIGQRIPSRAVKSPSGDFMKDCKAF